METKMETRNKVIYWIATGLLSAFMLMNALMYVFQNQMVSDMFISLGYPTYIIYLLAVAKVLGIAAILTRRSMLLKEWAPRLGALRQAASSRSSP